VAVLEAAVVEGAAEVRHAVAAGHVPALLAGHGLQIAVLVDVEVGDLEVALLRPLAVDQHLSLQRVVKAHNKIQNAGFTGAGRTNQSYRTPLGGFERNIPQNKFSRRVAETDPSEL